MRAVSWRCLDTTESVGKELNEIVLSASPVQRLCMYIPVTKHKAQVLVYSIGPVVHRTLRFLIALARVLAHVGRFETAMCTLKHTILLSCRVLEMNNKFYDPV